MAKTYGNSDSGSGNHFRFNLIGLIFFSLCLMAAASFITAKFYIVRQLSYGTHLIADPDDPGKTIKTHDGPWGELLVRDIQLERPAELISAEVSNPQPETWVFQGKGAAAVRALFVSCGLSAAEADKALAPARLKMQGNNLVFSPGDDFLLSLDEAVREKLYGAMYGAGVNPYVDYPYIFPRGVLETIYADERLHSDDVALLKKLVYDGGDAMHFSDYDLLMSRIPTKERRVTMSQVLSRQSAVLVRLHIRPDSDIDKIVSYWGQVPNVRFDDIRPLMQSLKALPEGGSISMLYLLPPFARERLYTYPVPHDGDPVNLDCHWTTFNFSNEKPDNRFDDPTFKFNFIRNNYYQINAPTVYGDVVLLMTAKGDIEHSAVFLADDLVFTKYGNNYTQPWIITHIPDMTAEYPGLRAVYLRKKTN